MLVASDAIGMGLNLNIKRVVFSELTKFNGTETAVLSASQMKQIAGRAGRAGGIYPEGEVAAFNDDDVALLLDGLAQPSDTVESAGLLPSTEQIILFAESWRRIHGSVPQLSRLLANFIEASQLDGDFFMCDSQAVRPGRRRTDRRRRAPGCPAPCCPWLRCSPTIAPYHPPLAPRRPPFPLRPCRWPRPSSASLT